MLVIDVGGSHVKMRRSGQDEVRRFESGRHLGAEEMVARVREMTGDWRYDVVSLGYPGPVGADGPLEEAGNLASGWVGFDFERAFDRPVRIANDAAMQALGGYAGGRMLFLGLGTGLGSALVCERVVIPLELGRLPFNAQETLADRVGKRGLARVGAAAWLCAVHDICRVLRAAFVADYLVLGGGNAEQVSPLPEGVRLGGNDDAFTGGFRLWDGVVEPHDRPPANVWRVLR